MRTDDTIAYPPHPLGILRLRTVSLQERYPSLVRQSHLSNDSRITDGVRIGACAPVTTDLITKTLLDNPPGKSSILLLELPPRPALQRTLDGKINGMASDLPPVSRSNVVKTFPPNGKTVVPMILI